MRKRLLATGLLVAALEGAAAIAMLEPLATPRLAKFFGLCALVTLSLSALIYRLLSRPPRGGDGGGGGSGPRIDPEPPWWPGFERDLERWSRERAGRTPAAR